MGFGDGRQQRLAIDVVRLHDLVAGLAKPVEAGLRDGVRDEYLHAETERDDPD